MDIRGLLCFCLHLRLVVVSKVLPVHFVSGSGKMNSVNIIAETTARSEIHCSVQCMVTNGCKSFKFISAACLIMADESGDFKFHQVATTTTIMDTTQPGSTTATTTVMITTQSGSMSSGSTTTNSAYKGCITDCTGVQGGTYQDCAGCENKFITCANDITYNMECSIPTQGLVWNDMLKTCDFTSPTCPLEFAKWLDRPRGVCALRRAGCFHSGTVNLWGRTYGIIVVTAHALALFLDKPV